MSVKARKRRPDERPIPPREAGDGSGGVLRIAATERRALMAGAALALVEAAVALAVPRLTGGFTQVVLEGETAVRGVALLLLGLVSLLAVQALLGFGSQAVVERARTRLAIALRTRLYERLQALPLRWFAHRRSGELLALFAIDLEALAAFATHAPARAVPLAITAAGAFLLMVRIDVWGALALVGASVPLWLLVRRLARPLADRAAAVAEAHGHLLGAIQENLDQVLTIKAFAGELAESERVAAANEVFRRAREAQLQRELLVSPLARAIGVGGAAVLLAVVLLRPGAPPLAPGELVTLVLLGLVFTRPLTAFAQIHAEAQQARSALSRLAPVWRAAPEPRVTSPAPRLAGSVSLRGVCFDHGPGRSVLHHLDLEIAPGELVALVGPNGAGKTTLARLLVRLLEPGAGRILLDGRDLREWDPPALRAQVAFATQETQLFDRSVGANIAYGGPDADAREIERAARRAGAHGFIERLPEGYATRVGQKGEQLSGGQRQRIALARALLKEPPLLILDEATSMLDADGEREFLERNRDWLRRRTVLLVTHRPTSLALADRRVLLRDGRAVELREERAGCARGTARSPAAPAARAARSR